jgi:hypothetical protein
MRGKILTLTAAVFGVTIVANGVNAERWFTPKPFRSEIVTRSVSVAPGTTEVLFEVPAGRSYLVRQVCEGDEINVFTDVVGSELGVVAKGKGCQEYIPGILFVGGETISCVSSETGFPGTFPPGTCLITGTLK